MAKNILFSGSIRNAILSAAVGLSKNSVNVNSSGVAYLELSKTKPTYNSSGEITNITKPTDTNYERKLIGESTASYSTLFNAPVAGVIKNKEEIHFNTASENWDGEWKYWAIYTSKTGGNPIIAGEFETAVTVSTNNIVCIKKNQMTLSMMPDTSQSV